MLLPQEIIRRKRDGGTLSRAEIAEFVAGVTDGRVADAQVAALAMAIFWRGLELDERVGLTLAMRDSGTVLDWADIPGPVLDKHSTGGVGDMVSLILAPAVAACGGYVPMISGRGLGHTGGTLDKLESIPGYNATPGLADFRRVTRDVGCAIIGQTSELAPADRRIYAIRDVTATVETLDLITPSILSKKLAAGLDALVLDVKVGSGAFLPDLEAAEALADSLVTVATGAGLPTVALLTDMDSALIPAAGNALEVRLAIDVLAGRLVAPRLLGITAALGGEMLVAGRLAPDADTGAQRIEEAILGGAAAEVFARMVSALGGPADLMERPDSLLPYAPVVIPVYPEGQGFVTATDMRALGLAVIALGGGRVRPTDPIDPAVGLDGLAGLGDLVGPGAPLGFVHARDAATAEEAARRVRAAYRVEAEWEPARPPLLIDRVGTW